MHRTANFQLKTITFDITVTNSRTFEMPQFLQDNLCMNNPVLVILEIEGYVQILHNCQDFDA